MHIYVYINIVNSLGLTITKSAHEDHLIAKVTFYIKYFYAHGGLYFTCTRAHTHRELVRIHTKWYVYIYVYTYKQINDFENQKTKSAHKDHLIEKLTLCINFFTRRRFIYHMHTSTRAQGADYNSLKYLCV